MIGGTHCCMVDEIKNMHICRKMYIEEQFQNIKTLKKVIKLQKGQCNRGTGAKVITWGLLLPELSVLPSLNWTIIKACFVSLTRISNACQTKDFPPGNWGGGCL